VQLVSCFTVVHARKHVLIAIVMFVPHRVDVRHARLGIWSLMETVCWTVMITIAKFVLPIQPALLAIQDMHSIVN
jgi:hypothetical protein